MKYTLEQFIDEAIQLEVNVADVYTFFSETFPADANFWATLAWEEKTHAAVLKTGKDVLLPMDLFPVEILPEVIHVLIETNTWLQSVIEDFAREKPDREAAFALAIKIESSAGEQHFQRVMETPAESASIKIFQELCEDDIHHLRRIREYMKNEGSVSEVQGDGLKRILIAIGDEHVAKLLQTIFQTEGDIDVIGNGRDGLQKIKDTYYDIIISAVEMEPVDGITMYKRAREFSPGLNVRFLFYTGTQTPELIDFFRQEDIRYLAKPATIDAIRAAVLNKLHHGQSRHDPFQKTDD